MENEEINFYFIYNPRGEWMQDTKTTNENSLQVRERYDSSEGAF